MSETERSVEERRSPLPAANVWRETGKRHPLFGALKGLAKTAPETDLTQPSDPNWCEEARFSEHEPKTS